MSKQDAFLECINLKRINYERFNTQKYKSYPKR